MEDGAFFSRSEVMRVKAPLGPILLPQCGPCGLKKMGCRSPMMKPDGEGRGRVLVVGEAPGEEEDREGRPFVGPTGKKLQGIMAQWGVDLRRDCWIDNAVMCFTGDVRVGTPSPVEKAYRRRYSGPLVTVRTGAGAVFTGTPNHPALTPTGWVALGDLKEGDDLIRCTFGEGVMSGGPDKDNPPPTFKELFRSLSELGDVQRVVGRGVDFHGDGEDCDINVVAANSLLGNGGQPAANEHGGQGLLIPTDVTPSCLLGNGGSFGYSPRLFGGSLAPSACVMGSPGDGLATVRSEGRHTEPHGVTFVSDGNAQTDEDEPKGFMIDPEEVRQRIKALSSLVTLDRIVHIERKTCDQLSHGDDTADGTTHVYNLQTVEGYYTVDGIVVSNCRPPKNKIGNKRRIDFCRPHVIDTVKRFNPEVILVLGAAAVRSVIGWLWKEDPGGIGKWSGWQIPCQELNAWVCPTHHPARLLWEDSPVLERELAEHVRGAMALPGRPWPSGAVPDWRRGVDVVLDPDVATGLLERIRGGVIAFDFENSCQKPDAAHSEIVSCSVCWNGEYTFAYPWHGSAIQATKELLQDPNVGKIASNLKHEHRWCLRVLGMEVKNWAWDTMISAHALDARKGITGLKFQAFALLGMSPYNDHIEPFLKPDRKGGYEPNRVDEIDLPNLLLYNGLDSLLEYKIAQIQARKLGVRL